MVACYYRAVGSNPIVCGGLAMTEVVTRYVRFAAFFRCRLVPGPRFPVLPAADGASDVTAQFGAFVADDPGDAVELETVAEPEGCV